MARNTGRQPNKPASYLERMRLWNKLGVGTPTRAEVRRAGEILSRNDTLYNRYQEHQWPAYERVLVVVQDVRGTPFFILQDMTGRTTWMRTRTLLKRYALHPSGPLRAQNKEL